MPLRSVDNLDFGKDFGVDEVRKVVSMAGVKHRPVVDQGVTATDLCFEAAVPLLDRLGWARDSITGVIMVTQSPDYVLPSSSCVAHKWLGLADHCAAFDMGQGCSGYPYGLYIASTMLKAGGHRRILMLNGDTPSRFTSPQDHATSLLFSDAGSATALELGDAAAPSFYALHTDGAGMDSLIIRGGGFRDRNPVDPRDNFVRMDGAAVFNFTLKRVPPLIRQTLEFAGLGVADIDWFLFHQSNRFIMKHLAKKCGLPEERTPIILEHYGNCGGPSVALALTQALGGRPAAPSTVLMLGYGVGLSWGAALARLDADTVLLHSTYSGAIGRA
ncbi:MAG: ketoacyl-ACP synthase III [Rhizobacter sp.]|nr:ketoacyl-ACP synthase III [Rhizobacter sp.]